MRNKKLLYIFVVLACAASLLFTCFFTGHAFVQFTVVDLTYLGTHRFDAHYADEDIYQDSTIRGTVGGGAGLTTLNAFRTTSYSSTPRPGLDYIGFYGVSPVSFKVDSKYACYVAITLALPSSSSVDAYFMSRAMMLGGTSAHPSYALVSDRRTSALSMLEVPYYDSDYTFSYDNQSFTALTYVFQIDSYYMGTDVNRFFFKWSFPIETYGSFSSPYVFVSDIVVFLDNGANSSADLKNYDNYDTLESSAGSLDSLENDVINSLPDQELPEVNSADVNQSGIQYGFWVSFIDRIVNSNQWLTILLYMSMGLGLSAFLFTTFTSAVRKR